MRPQRSGALAVLLLATALAGSWARPKPAPAAVYAPTREGRRAAWEGQFYLRAPLPPGGKLAGLAKRITGDARNVGAILKATPRKKGRTPAEIRVPIALLLPAYRSELLLALFPEDRRVPKGWEHAWRRGPMARREGWESVASWFTGSNGNAPKIREANRKAGSSPAEGAAILIPESLLLPVLREIPAPQEAATRGKEPRAAEEVPAPVRDGTPRAPEDYGPPAPKAYGPPAPPQEAPANTEEVPLRPVPKAPKAVPTPEPTSEPPAAGKPAEMSRAAPQPGPTAGPPLPVPEGSAPAKEPGPKALPVPQGDFETETATDAPPALEYGKDGEGPYALYRLRQGEALYSAVAARFTGRINAADVNEMAFKIARRSGIEDVTTIPTGFAVKIPLGEVLPQYLPQDDPRFKAWAKRKAAAGQFTNTYKSAALEGVVVILDSGHGGLDRGAMHHGVWEDSYVYDIACRIHQGLEHRTKARVLMILHNPDLGYEPQDRESLPPNKGAVILTHPWYKPSENKESKFAVNLRWYLANQYYLRLQAEGVDPQRVVFTSLHADSLHPSLRGAMFYVAGSEYRPRRWSSKGAVYEGYEEYRAGRSFSLSEKELTRSEGLSLDFTRRLERAFRKAKLPTHPYQATRDHVVRGGRSWVPAVIRNSIVPCSVLLEVCNLNNTSDAKMLKDPVFRQKIADAYIAALIKYYS